MLLSPPALHFPRDETSRSDYTRKDVPNIGCTAFIRNTFGNGNKIVVFENAEVEVAALMLRVRSGPPFTKRSGDMVYTMPWKERSVVEERMRFVLWLKGGLWPRCAAIGISRVTAVRSLNATKSAGGKD